MDSHTLLRQQNLKFRIDRYKSRLPQAADVLLLVEIADLSMQYGRDIKLPLYACHGIPECWIINTPEQQVEVYSDPESDRAQYRQTNIVTQGALAPARFPDAAFDAGEILG